MKSLVLVVLSSILLFNCSSNNEKIDEPVIDISGVWKEITNNTRPPSNSITESEYDPVTNYTLIVKDGNIEIIEPTLGSRHNYKMISIDLVNSSEMDITWNNSDLSPEDQVVRTNYQYKEGELVIENFFFIKFTNTYLPVYFPDNLIPSKFIIEPKDN